MTRNVDSAGTLRVGEWRRFASAFAANRGALAGLAVLIAVVVVALGADLLAPHAPNLQDRATALAPPMWQANGRAAYPLGTDALGRDMLSRLLHGARYSLLIGVAVVAMALVAGVAAGLAAGFFGGVLDLVVVRSMDVLLALPSLLLAIVVVAILGPGLFHAMIAIAVVQLPHIVRLTRAVVLVERTKTYVASTRLAGARPFHLMLRTILPNCMPPLLVQATLAFSSAILEAAALGFLGLGAQPPTPEWGTMLAESREFVLRAWWVVTLPGLAILATVLALNLFGDGLRDALDPKLRHA